LAALCSARGRARQTADEYVEIAAALAQDQPRLAELRSTLRERMQQSSLMDAPRFAREVESAYRRMWVQWCSGGYEYHLDEDSGIGSPHSGQRSLLLQRS
jgi:hypothetical protein